MILNLILDYDLRLEKMINNYLINTDDLDFIARNEINSLSR